MPNDDNGPLIVPVQVDALAVNDEVRSGVPFMRWQADFNLLADNLPPEGGPFDNNRAAHWDTDTTAGGVYLQWQLPQALRNGVHDPETGDTTFPLVPNRWLVVRYSGPTDDRTADSWMIESDWLPGDGETGTSPYLRPGTSRSVHIGRRTAASEWPGESGGQSPFVTAAGPGLLTFSAFQPFNENVLSLHDDLAGVADQETLGYLVAGWYSAPGADPLHEATSLASLGWALAADPDADTPPTDRTLCTGQVLGLSWDRTGSVPASDRPQGVDVDVAVGNSSIDALTALLVAKGTDAADAARLEALAHGLLDGLDDSGTESVDQSIHRAWFGSTHGGFVWDLVDDGTGTGTGGALAELRAKVNTDQAAHDALVRQLADTQWKLYGAWWLNNADEIPDAYTDALPATLNPTEQDGLAARVAALASDIAARRDPAAGHPQAIPWGATDEDLATAAQAYLAAHGADPAARTLKRSPLGEFHHAQDPVVLLNGIKTPTPADLGAALPCRTPGQLLTGIDLGSGLAPAPATVPGPPLTRLAEAATIGALLGEFWLLDRAQAAGTLDDAVAHPEQKVTGVLPALGTSGWRQPWKPLYLLYELFYYPLPQGSWTFDGTRYHWDGTGTPGDYQSYTGRMFLTPHATFNLAARIRQYRATHPDAPQDELQQLADQVAGWDLLSQATDGLASRIALREPDLAAHPTDDQGLATLIGPQYRTAPVPGGRPSRSGKWPASRFPQLRAGQFYFNRIAVVDQFGQVTDPINPQGSGSSTDNDKKPLVLADSVRPDDDATVLPEFPYRYAELRPRLLQGARLRFDAVSATDDSQVLDLNAGVNPVCGWLLPNHLDTALAAFDPDGGALGECRTVRTDGDQQQVVWDPAPGSAYPTLDSLAPELPHLAGFLTGLATAGPEALAATLAAIDETLYTVNPLGGWDDTTMTVLAGRPLALLRTRLAIELDGPPIMDPSWEQWQYVLDPSTDPPRPAWLDDQWGVRLGALENLADGLIGYTSGDDSTTLHAVHLPPDAPSYLTGIGAGFPLTAAGTPQYLTLLADPRGTVHAVSDILPVSVLTVPAEFITAALARMEVSFRLGPVLTGPQNVTGADGSTATAWALPRPSVRHGDWSWTEPTSPTGWQESPLAPVGTPGHIPATPLSARTGRLRLRGAVTDNQ
ncbi:hypothetical protein ACFVUY_11280 [Kitasatospora sp. NPDC058063]|uniref:hypothetical protein n=1 Tax=unclassified Kitasatospora TaxID=2633591 RepID=UPI0036D9F665